MGPSMSIDGVDRVPPGLCGAVGRASMGPSMSIDGVDPLLRPDGQAVRRASMGPSMSIDGVSVHLLHHLRGCVLLQWGRR